MKSVLAILIMSTCPSMVLSFKGAWGRYNAVQQALIQSLVSTSRKYATTNPGWSDDTPESFSTSQTLPQIPSNVVEFMDTTLGSMVTGSAIDTVSYYMIEFHDDVTQKWMISFNGYNANGFTNSTWEAYLNDLIDKDPLEIKVFMNPKRVASRTVQPTERDSKMKVMFMHDIEPRKLAHRIVTVREEVCLELIQDLGSIRVENEEAIKYANECINDSKDAAEKHRGMTRATVSGSTPLRHTSFRDIALLVTNLALDIVRAELKAADDQIALTTIERILEEVSHEGDGKSSLDQLVCKERGPRRFIEELCVLGLSGGSMGIGATEVEGTQSDSVDADTAAPGAAQQKTNYLKVAQTVLDTRLALSLEACKILNEQCRVSRHFFKLIKDKGGFKAFNMRDRPKMKIVNIDEELAKDEAAATADADKAKAATTAIAPVASSASSPAGSGSRSNTAKSTVVNNGTKQVGPSDPRPLNEQDSSKKLTAAAAATSTSGGGSEKGGEGDAGLFEQVDFGPVMM